MSATPFIKPIRLQGGTFYTFSSASEDLGFSFNNDDKKFRFSNYALLNIPDIRTAVSNENYIQFDAVPTNFDIDGSKSLNTYLAESFQNYCLNLETIITSNTNYDPEAKRTVSERVFFKWLKEIGALRFRQASTTELSDPVFGVHYVEEDESEIYTRVIQYVGEIDVVNNVRNNSNAYTEVYVHLPTSHGRQPSILFTATDDANYSPNAEFTNDPADPLDQPYIVGREPSDSHPAGLSFLAQYDSTGSYSADDPTAPGAGKFFSYNTVTMTWEEAGVSADFYWWYPTPKSNTYFLEKSSFNDPTNDKFKIESSAGTLKSVEFVRSRLDGISLEFDENAYADIAVNADINSFGELAESGLSSNFNFNAVLVYYELYDPLNPADSVKNLFGILFLDNVDPLTGGGGAIPRIPKYKPNPLTGDNGNAYSFKINLKFDVSAEDAAVETTINDYNTFSLELYIDALNELKETTRIFTENSAKLVEIESLLQETRSLVLDNPTAEEVNQRITQLETVINESQQIFASNQEILDLIDRNYTEILNIYNNQTSLQVAYNLNVIQEGVGINVDRTSDQFVKISSSNQAFNLTTKPRLSLVTDFVLSPNRYSYTVNLQNFSNYMKITDGSTGTPFNVDRDVALFINDFPTKWEAGQRFRISFTNGLDMSNTNGNFNLLLFTDSQDTLDTGFTYSAPVGIIGWEEFEAKNSRPLIEIICIDPVTYDFDLDIF
jgi:hypothetical protein